MLLRKYIKPTFNNFPKSFFFKIESKSNLSSRGILEVTQKVVFTYYYADKYAKI